MTVKVIKQFYDKQENLKLRKVDETFDVDNKRAETLSMDRFEGLCSFSGRLCSFSLQSSMDRFEGFGVDVYSQKYLLFTIQYG